MNCNEVPEVDQVKLKGDRKKRQLYRKQFVKPCTRKERSSSPPYYKQSNEVKLMKSQNVDRIFLKIDDKEFQTINLITENDIQLLKKDKKEYLKSLIKMNPQLFPDELINFEPKKLQCRETVKSKVTQTYEKLNMKELGFGSEPVSEQQDEDEENMHDVSIVLQIVPSLSLPHAVICTKRVVRSLLMGMMVGKVTMIETLLYYSRLSSSSSLNEFNSSRSEPYIQNLFFLLFQQLQDQVNLFNSFNIIFIMQDAIKLLQTGQLDGALQILDQEIAAKADNFQAWFFKGQALQHKKEFNQSIPCLIEAIRLNGKLFQAHLALGNSYVMVHQYKEALEEFDKFSSSKPEAAPIPAGYLTNRGMALAGLGKEDPTKYDEAMKCFKEAIEAGIKANKQDFTAMSHMAMVLVDLQRLDEAQHYYTLATGENNTDPHLFYNKGINELSLSPPRLEEAIVSFQKAIGLNKDYVQAHFSLGNAYQLKKEHSLALDSFEKALKLDPQNFQGLCNKGLVLAELNRLDEARDCFNQAVNIYTASPGQVQKTDAAIAYNGLGSTLDVIHKYPEALQAYKQAAELDPTNGDAHYNLGNQYKHINKLKEAIDEYNLALSLKPSNRDAVYLNKGSSLQLLKDYDGAAECYKEALKIVPNSADAHNNLGTALKNLKKNDEALNEYNEAIKCNQNYVLAYTNRAQIYLILDRKKEAIEDIHKVDELCQDQKNLAHLSESNQTFIKESVKQIIALEKQFNEKANKLQENMKGLPQIDQDKINKQMELIQKKKDEQNKILLEAMAEKKPQDTKQQAISDAEILLEIDKLMKESERLQQEQLEVKKLQEENNVQINEVKEEQKEMKQTLEVAGMYDKAQIKRDFEDLQKNDKVLYDYAKAFYWTLLNRFDAYRLAATGVFKQNLESTVDSKESLAMSATHAVLGLAAAIPMIGGFFKSLDSVIESVHGKIKENRYEQRMNSIVSIIMKNNDPKAQLKEEQSMMLAKAAIEIARRKKSVFAKRQEDKAKNADQPVGKMTQALNYLKRKVQELKAMALGDKISIFDSEGGEEALQDTIVVLAFMFKNHEDIIKKEQPLDEQIADMVVQKSCFSILADSIIDEVHAQVAPAPQAAAPESQGKQSAEVTRESSCCTVM